VAHEFEAEFACNAFLQFLDFGIVELDDLAGLDVDQMIMVLPVCWLIASTASTEVAFFQNAFTCKQFQRAVDRRHRYARVRCVRPRVDLLDVGMILGR
jgi:hypothetical protein